MRRALIGSFIAALSIFAACFDSPDPLYCDEDTPCTDPERPFCDLTGQHPASDGQGRTCIPDPGVDGPDGGQTCELSSECPSGAPICDGVCRGCEGDVECETRDLAAPYCDTEAGACVECLTEAECTTATAPVCESGACRGCESHDECASGACEQDTGRCLPAGDVVYVDPAAGADGPTCGTQELPCKTLGGASGALSHVDGGRPVVSLAAGTYAESVTIRGLDVTLIGPAEAVIQPPGGARGLGIEGDALVVVDGLTVDSAISGAQGILCAAGAGPVPTVTVRNAQVTNNDGIGIEASDCTLTVEQSTVSGNAGGGISTSGGTVTIEQTTVSGNAGGGISIQNAGFRIVNNFVVENGNPLSSTRGGIRIAGPVPEGEAEFAFNTVAKNGIVDAESDGAGVQCRDLVQPLALSNSVVYGNVDANEAGPAAQVSGNCTWSYSLIQGGAIGGTNVDADPRFVEADEGDFHLQPSSPAVDAAAPDATLEVDVDGDVRPQGVARDIGADEVVAR